MEKSIEEFVNKVILDPQYADILAIVKAVRNGAVYGTKVRFPHALVTVFLFRSGTVREKLRLVFKATRQHARNLATFALVYKTSMVILRHAKAPHSGFKLGAGKEGPYDTFIAGLIGGYTVFGRGRVSSVSKQIVIYIFARVVLAVAKLAVQTRDSAARGVYTEIPPGSAVARILPDEWKEGFARNTWPVFASLSWGAVMWMFKNYPETLQPSLRSSMRYIYQDSDHWDSFRNFLVYNK